MTTWVVSDTHFFHQNLITYGIRYQYVDADDMNYYIESEWNAMVKPNDKVIHLGDFALGTDHDKIEELCKRLNGNVTLCLGNHDTPAKVKLLSRYFNICSQFQIDEFLFSHTPVHPNYLNEKSLRSSVTNARFNVHGHDHNGTNLGNRYLNLCWDAMEKQRWFKNHFVDLDWVLSYLRTIGTFDSEDLK